MIIEPTIKISYSILLNCSGTFWKCLVCMIKHPEGPASCSTCVSLRYHSLPLTTLNTMEKTVVSHTVLCSVLCSFSIHLRLHGVLFISSLPHQRRCNIKNQLFIKFLPVNNHWLIPSKKSAFTLFFCNVQCIFLASYFSCWIIIIFIFSIMFTRCGGPYD